MGDIAEAKFLQLLPLGQADRYGLRRPNVNLGATAPFVLHTPDFLTSSGWLVEVMGVGKDQIVKLKELKLNTLVEWNEKQRVALFVWDSHNERGLLTPLDTITSIVADIPTKAFENDGNVYYPIPTETLATDPTTVTC